MILGRGAKYTAQDTIFGKFHESRGNSKKGTEETSRKPVVLNTKKKLNIGIGSPEHNVAKKDKFVSCMSNDRDLGQESSERINSSKR